MNPWYFLTVPLGLLLLSIAVAFVVEFIRQVHAKRRDEQSHDALLAILYASIGCRDSARDYADILRVKDPDVADYLDRVSDQFDHTADVIRKNIQ